MSDLVSGRTGEWEVVIGLEVHAQVSSSAKLFSGAPTKFGAEPNQNVSLVDAAMPGMSVPAGFNQAGLPLGLQVLAKPFDEASIYKVGKVIEDSAAISTMPQRMAGGA